MVRKLELVDVLAETLAAVFQPDELGRLVRRGIGRRKARIRAVWLEDKRESTIEVELSSLGRLSIPKAALERSIFTSATRRTWNGPAA